MKKLLCLILAVVMLFALAACGRSGNEDGKKTNRGEFATKPTVTEPAPGDPTMEPSTELPTEPTTPPAVENALAGSWSSKVVVDAEKMEMENVDASMECFINMELNDDMTYQITIDQEALAASIQQFLEAIKGNLAEMTYKELEAQGLTREQVDEMILQAYGMTMEELCAQMAEEIDIDEIMAEYQELLPVSGTYRVEGNMLYITQTDGEGSVEEIAFSYELVDGKLHITSNDEEVQEFFELIGGTDLEFTAN
jgi:hypothetical protein